jgi:hypothetical protein
METQKLVEIYAGPALEVQIVGEFPSKSKIWRLKPKYLVRIRLISRVVPSCRRPWIYEKSVKLQKVYTIFTRLPPEMQSNPNPVLSPKIGSQTQNPNKKKIRPSIRIQTQVQKF